MTYTISICDFAYHPLRIGLREQAIVDGRAHEKYIGDQRTIKFPKPQLKDAYAQITQDNEAEIEAAILSRERQIVERKARGILFTPRSTRRPLAELTGESV